MKQVYLELREKIGSLDASTTAFPDSSVDRYYRVKNGSGDIIQEKTSFTEKIQKGRTDYWMVPERKEPGGVAVNMASQCSQLGLETQLHGHLNHPVFNQLEMETRSMGEPTKITLYEFNDGDLLLAREDQEPLDWKLQQLAPETSNLNEELSKDLICCANWTTASHLRTELEKILELEPDAQLFNFDLGPLMEARNTEIEKLFNVLGSLDKQINVVVHANSREVQRVEEALKVEGSKEEKLRDVRADSGISGLVLHDKPHALAATRKGIIEVENLETRKQETFSGAGDRFSAACGAGLASGLSWKESLALGNLCALNYIEENSTATQHDIQNQIDSRIDR